MEEALQRLTEAERREEEECAGERPPDEASLREHIALLEALLASPGLLTEEVARDLRRCPEEARKTLEENREEN